MPPKKQRAEDAKDVAHSTAQGTLEAATPDQIVSELLDNEQYGRLYTTELNLRLDQEHPDDLFKWLCCAILFSSGLSEALTLRACKVLLEEKLLDSPSKTQETASESFVGALDHKFQRKEQTAKYLHSAASLLVENYDSNLFNLREKSKKDPESIKSKLKEIKGLAEVGVSIFFREAQLLWPELVPYIDKRAVESASQMGLPATAEDLYQLVGKDTKKLATLAAALVRVSLAKDKGVQDIAEGVEAGSGDAGHTE